jgi:hypothetical protein
MIRLDDDFFWQGFDNNHLQFKEMTEHSPAPTTGSDIFRRKISIRLNSCQYRFSQLSKWTPRGNLPLWRESPLLSACRAKIFCDKKLCMGKPNPQQPMGL